MSGTFDLRATSGALSNILGRYTTRTGSPPPVPGAFGRFAPPVGTPLPRNEDGTEFVYNPSTGSYDGTVYETGMVSRIWLTLNATTVRTIKASGGDYTPAQYPQALQDAATANDFRVLVVDPGLDLAFIGTNYPAKTGTPNWTWTVTADYWSGAWEPETARITNQSLPLYYNRATESGRLFNILGGTSNNQSNINVNGAGRNRYGFIGARIKRNLTPAEMILLGYISNYAATSLDQLPTEWIWKWCEFDGVWKEGSTYYETRVGMRFEGHKGAFLNCSMIGFGGTGSDPQCIVAVNGGKRIKVIECLLEAAGENILIGGGTNDAAGKDWFRPSDIEVRRTYFTKRQDWNPASSLWNPAGPSPIAKNLFETKDGLRLFFEDCEFENSFVQAQNGPGIVLKTTSQSSTSGFYHNDGNTFSHCRVRSVTTGVVFLGRDSGTLAEWSIIAPTSNTVFRNVLFEHGPVLQLNGVLDAGTGGALLQANGSDSDPQNRPFGPLSFRWCTAVSRDAGLRNVFFAVSNRDYTGFEFSDCVVDEALYGINGDGPVLGSVTDAAVLEANQMLNVKRNAFVPTTWLQRANWQASFPEQHAPAALWPANRAGIGFTNYSAGDYSLASSSPLKGLGDSGFDPGYDKAVLDARLARVRNVTPFQVTFV